MRPDNKTVCPRCGGSLILDKGATPSEDRLRCIGGDWSISRADAIELKNKKGGPMANRLSAEKEEEVKALLKTHSVREIEKETGVAGNTITRIRNENLTEEEREEIRRSANVRGRNKRELQKRIKDISSGEKEGVMNEKGKPCTKCKKEFPVTNEFFSKNRRNPDGFERWCKDCKKKQQQDYRDKKAGGVNPKKMRSRTGASTPKYPVTRATPDEIIKALKVGIRKEAADEIFSSLGQSLAQIRERFA